VPRVAPRRAARRASPRWPVLNRGFSPGRPLPVVGRLAFVRLLTELVGDRFVVDRRLFPGGPLIFVRGFPSAGGVVQAVAAGSDRRRRGRVGRWRVGARAGRTGGDRCGPTRARRSGRAADAAMDVLPWNCLIVGWSQPPYGTTKSGIGDVVVVRVPQQAIGKVVQLPIYLSRARTSGPVHARAARLSVGYARPGRRSLWLRRQPDCS
jgi:hypothetical protein